MHHGSVSSDALQSLRTREIQTVTPTAAAQADPAALARWIGRTERRADRVTSVPLAALAATLDRDDPPPAEGAAIAPLRHWLYFLPLAPTRELGPDGHPKRGGFLPPVPLPRRMWAAGRPASAKRSSGPPRSRV